MVNEKRGENRIGGDLKGSARRALTRGNRRTGNLCKNAKTVRQLERSRSRVQRGDRIQLAKQNDIVMRGETSDVRKYRLSSTVLDGTNYGGDPPRYKSKKVKVHITMSVSRMFRIHP